MRGEIEPVVVNWLYSRMGIRFNIGFVFYVLDIGSIGFPLSGGPDG